MGMLFGGGPLESTRDIYKPGLDNILMKIL